MNLNNFEIQWICDTQKKKNGLTYQESAENWIVYLPLNKKEAFYEKDSSKNWGYFSRFLLSFKNYCYLITRHFEPKHVFQWILFGDNILMVHIDANLLTSYKWRSSRINWIVQSVPYIDVHSCTHFSNICYTLLV